MKRKAEIWQLAGFFAVSLLGTLLHFLYDNTQSPAAALISSVNESTWEHMKLLFFPMLLFSAVEGAAIGKDNENFRCVKLRGAVLGLLLIPIVFYTLRGVFGATPDWVNIAIFFVAAAVAFIYETKKLKADALPCKYPKAAIALLGLIAAAFIVFTFITPEIPLFRDPVDGSFGLPPTVMH